MEQLYMGFSRKTRSIDNVISLNAPKFDVDHIYLIELEINNITKKQLILFHTLTYTLKQTARVGLERNFTTKEMISISHLHVATFQQHQHMGVFISQLVRYSRACGSYENFLDSGLQLATKLLKLGFLVVKLKSSLWKFYDRHADSVTEYLCYKWPRICSVCNYTPVMYSFMTYHQIFNKNDMTDATSGAETVYSSEEPGIAPICSWGSSCSNLGFCVVFSRPL